MRKIPHNINTDRVAYKFITIDNIKEASVEDLKIIDVIGEETARRCIRFAELDSTKINPEPNKKRVQKFKQLAMSNNIIKSIIFNNHLESYDRLYYEENRKIKIRL